MKTLLLLVLAGYCLSVCGSVSKETHARSDGDRDGSTVLPELNGVLLLTKEHFNRALQQHNQLLVHFFAPLSGDSQRLDLLFRGAVEQLTGLDVKLGVVDVSKETKLAKELNATTPPPLRLYESGDRYNPVHCPVFQSSASIVTWLKRRAGPSADIIADLDQSDRFVASEELVVLGLFKDVEQGYVKLFYAAACDLPDLSFSVTQNQNVFGKYDIIHDSVLLLRQSEVVQVFEVTSQTSKEDLISFISVYQLELVTEYNGQTASRILSSTVVNHAILFVNKTDEGFPTVHSAFQAAAAIYRGQTLDMPTITAFCQSYLEGKAQPKMQSEVEPADWDLKPVKQLVGQTLERVAFNPDKTVFIMFYLPYSAESRSLFPLWEELAQHFLDRQEIVIARIDASANDINLSMRERYPTLRLFPALHAERVVAYSGRRTLNNLVQFVEKEMKRAKKERVQEEKDRKKYIEEQKAMEAKEAKKAKESKQEL
ncbi:protein disulfide-isomerase isoform X2 [Esox lucius]|uniref:protein disulfide-isomerase isoform X2 n=1 Tax=Esox lucius TaxID=8010 RepID=UPI0009733E0B|nr:protein disulfide-isomerase isoform X2 [Esox lucius]